MKFINFGDELMNVSSLLGIKKEGHDKITFYGAGWVENPSFTSKENRDRCFEEISEQLDTIDLNLIQLPTGLEIPASEEVE